MKENKMISSIVWLILLGLEKIDPQNAPWSIYLPAVLVEYALTIIFLPKIMDKFDEWRKKND
jgi:hypothetical protein